MINIFKSIIHFPLKVPNSVISHYLDFWKPLTTPWRGPAHSLRLSRRPCLLGRTLPRALAISLTCSAAVASSTWSASEHSGTDLFPRASAHVCVLYDTRFSPSFTENPAAPRHWLPQEWCLAGWFLPMQPWTAPRPGNCLLYCPFLAVENKMLITVFFYMFPGSYFLLNKTSLPALTLKEWAYQAPETLEGNFVFSALVNTFLTLSPTGFLGTDPSWVPGTSHTNCFKPQAPGNHDHQGRLLFIM